MHKRNNNNKVIIILCLLAIVVSLSIGFSVFSNNLIIKQGATVTPDPSDFKVLFSSSKDSLNENGVVSTLLHGDGTSALNPKINNSDPLHPSVSGIKVIFKKPASDANYYLYVTNQGNYTAYLKNIKFGNKTCTAKDGTSQELVNEACNHIRVQVNFGEVNDRSNPLYAINIDKSVSNHPLEKGEFELFRIWIGYGYENPNAPVADGDFDVTFGDITLTYSSSDS